MSSSLLLNANRMPPDALRTVLDYGVLACAAEPFDPMERGFHDLGRRLPGSAPSSARTNGEIG